MDKVERAVELFRKLEGDGADNVADIAKRMFYIRDRLAGN